LCGECTANVADGLDCVWLEPVQGSLQRAEDRKSRVAHIDRR
jgi:hypothetical protein